MGRNIVDRLAARFPGRVLGTYFRSKPPKVDGADWIKADLCSSEAVSDLFQAGDMVIQVAASTSGARDTVERPYVHVTDNAVINSLLLRAAFEKSVGHFIFLSCPVMYPSDLGRALKEDDFPGAIPVEYQHFGSGWTKVYIEKVCQFYAKLGRTRHTVIRHSNTYGPYDKFRLEGSHMYAATVAKVMRAPADGEITVWGPGTEGRDLIYVGDVVDLVTKALEEQQTPFELVNAGGGRAYTVNEVVQTIIEASGKKLSIRHDLTQPHIPTTTWLDSARAEQLFNWRPKTSLQEGTALTLDWYGRNCTV
jgi:Nucleoside-diphosphate-sugar epimerases